MRGAVSVCMVAIALGMSACGGPADPEPARLVDVLAKTAETRGVDAAVAEYRVLRAQGFPGLRARESDLNRLGYRLLRKGDAAGAVRVLALNVETHPGSANAHDSLGEACVAAGDTARAIESYRAAVAIDPRMKSAVAALAELTGIPRPPLPPLALFHIGAGTVGILSGALAMVLRKGSRRHGLAGSVFVLSMLCMSATGAYMSFVAPVREVANVLMGIFTFYLVSTAWLAARRRDGGTGVADRVGLVAGLAIAAAFAACGVDAARGHVAPGEPGAPLFFVFGSLALAAALLDLRMIVRGGVSGAARVARHLWRMCAALFIAVGSLFLGQPQVFPRALRDSGLLGVPPLLVIVLLVFWLFRVLRTRTHSRRTTNVSPVTATPSG